MKAARTVVTLLVALLVAGQALAGESRIHVAEFKVAGSDTKAEEMQATLQELLASRLSGGSLVATELPEGADYRLSGRYTQAGGAFSVDVVLKDAAGTTAARAFEEGSSSADLIPALGRLAQRLRALVAQQEGGKPVGPSPEPVPQLLAAPAVAPAAAAPAVGTPREESAPPLWLSPRLTGTFVGMAPGQTLPDGTREVYLAGQRSLQLLRLGESPQLVAEVSFRKDQQVIGVDSADLDGDGAFEVYLTMFDGDALVSEVWIFRDGSFRRLADKLPYYFRALALNGGGRKIYAQKMSLNEDFQGAVHELVKKGDSFEITRPMKLPHQGYLYNFNQVSDRRGNLQYLELSEEGRLVVMTGGGEELWRSREKYAASELYFRRELRTDVRFNGEPFRKIFLKQRMEVTPGGHVIVPQNVASSVFGANGSSYLCGLTWNGSGMEKKWRSTESENYLADFFYDYARQELVRLETAKPAGMFDKGASIISIQKLSPHHP